MTSSHRRIMRELIILLSIRITSPQGLGRKKISISEKVHHGEREKRLIGPTLSNMTPAQQI